MLAQAFKEWAVICRALAVGKQSLLLRKGGIAEPRTFDLAETSEYLGCKSWVKLGEGLSTAGSTPVLDDQRYDEFRANLDLLLQPTALA